MHTTKGKTIFLSVILVNAGAALLMPGSCVPQTAGQQSHSVQAAPAGQHPAGHPQIQGPGSWNSSQQWNGGGRWNNQRMHSENRNSGEKDGNSGVDRFRSTDRDKDGNENRDKGRDHERNRNSDRDKHDRIRDKNNGHDLSAFWGVPYGGYFPYGYTEGSNSLPKASPHDMGYSDGFGSGQYDKIHGNLYNPRQYERSSNSDYFEGFVAGYQDGFRR